jgi:hypothetical protein
MNAKVFAVLIKKKNKIIAKKTERIRKIFRALKKK